MVWLLLLAAAPLHAEVMDKVSPLSGVWAWAAPGAILGFFACRFRPLLGLITFPAAALRPYGVVTEIQDPFVGPAIQTEAGFAYIVPVYAALGLVILCHVAGALLGIRRAKRRQPQPS